ncbi:MAG: complex I NDUFA9 subunit family protein [Sphingomonadales bacterium 32-68-7]|nr:MAG: complex I NDUFA9 subunit family protein [Sphingomonadales bacterium 12-68-11]OYX10296.1 MAG: complex I NDUFA9 subunit family protein [Sphingomonadales bacterium 32-68-7]
MARRDPLEDKLVVLIGGGGFLGTCVAQALLQRGARLRIADRHPEKAFNLKPLANLGQIQFVRCDVAGPGSLDALLHGADAAAYLVGTFGANQQALQADGAGRAAQAAAAAGAQAFAYVSAIGADPASDSGYARTKGEGEALVRAAFPQATVLRPSVLFGEDDQFLNMFAGLIAALPAVPVFGPDARLQPLWVDDAAEALAAALADPRAHGGKTYELAGPEVLTMAELHRRIAAAQGRESRLLIAVPDALSGLFAALPGTPLGADQWKLLQRGSVASGTLPGLAELGIAPRPLGLFLDRWMTRYRKHGRFGDKREAA